MDLKEYLNTNLFPGQKRTILGATEQSKNEYNYRTFEPFQVWIDLHMETPFDDYHREDMTLADGWGIYIEYKTFYNPKKTEIRCIGIESNFAECVKFIKDNYILEDIIS